MSNYLINESESAFLADLLTSPDGIASMDSAPPPFDKKPFPGGGKWRGEIPKSLKRNGIIEPVAMADKLAMVNTKRPSRHRGIVQSWKLADRPAALQRLKALATNLKSPKQRTLFDLD